MLTPRAGSVKIIEAGGAKVNTLRCCGALDIPGARHKNPTECAEYRMQAAAKKAVNERLAPRRAVAKRAAARPAAYLYAAKGLTDEADSKGYPKCKSFFQHGCCNYDAPEHPCKLFPCAYKNNAITTPSSSRPL